MRRFAAVTALALGLVALAIPARAATVDVAISGFAFAPSTVVVDPGDTVRWTNADAAPHTVTATDGSFDSGTLGQGGSFDRVFPAEGVFGYFCAIHPSMTGTVRVGDAGAPPSAPLEFTAAPSLQPGVISMFWRAPSDDGGAPVLRYRLCRGTSPSSTTACVFVTGTALSQSGLPLLQTQHYRLTAINVIGEGPAATACSKPGPWLAALGC